MQFRTAAVCIFMLLASGLQAADIQNLRFKADDGTEMLYGLLVPDGYRTGRSTPLILALHPGGERMRYYGSAYTRAIVAPGAASLNAIIVAPDCPAARAMRQVSRALSTMARANSTWWRSPATAEQRGLR